MSMENKQVKQNAYRWPPMQGVQESAIKRPYPAGTAVSVRRPGQAYDGWYGRVANRQPPTAERRWVAFRPPGGGEGAPDACDAYSDQSKFTHVLLPIDELRVVKPRPAK